MPPSRHRDSCSSRGRREREEYDVVVIRRMNEVVMVDMLDEGNNSS